MNVDIDEQLPEFHLYMHVIPTLCIMCIDYFANKQVEIEQNKLQGHI